MSNNEYDWKQIEEWNENREQQEKHSMEHFEKMEKATLKGK